MPYLTFALFTLVCWAGTYGLCFILVLPFHALFVKDMAFNERSKRVSTIALWWSTIAMVVHLLTSLA